ncbi:unnamed protein product [Oikopleura dioica]|uniref:Chromatin target of PRMT1 protein C-terminal domain-containing protein n=1 Tax=Oikopleura dioica TaxID=34765 RepID=E4XC89_OIKDI|nr:unnamed protein product [Oikopleura dioica]
MSLKEIPRTAIPSTSKCTLHSRFTKLMMTRPRHEDYTAEPPKEGSERNRQLAAGFEKKDSVKEELDRELDAYVQKRKAIKENEVVEAKIAKLEDKSEIKEEIEENKSDNLNTEIDDAVSKDGSPDDIELFTLDQKDGNEI